MSKQKELNTGVKITDKGGNTFVYDSIEKASEMTQMSIQTLKIRANKIVFLKMEYKLSGLIQKLKNTILLRDLSKKVHNQSQMLFIN